MLRLKERELKSVVVYVIWRKKRKGKKEKSSSRW